MPKPWRIEVSGRPPRWPWDHAGDEAVFRKWDARDQAAAVKFATCEYVVSLGAPGIDPRVGDIVRAHDQQSGVGSGRPLA